MLSSPPGMLSFVALHGSYPTTDGDRAGHQECRRSHRCENLASMLIACFDACCRERPAHRTLILYNELLTWWELGTSGGATMAQAVLRSRSVEVPAE